MLQSAQGGYRIFTHPRLGYIILWDRSYTDFASYLEGTDMKEEKHCKGTKFLTLFNLLSFALIVLPFRFYMVTFLGITAPMFSLLVY